MRLWAAIMLVLGSSVALAQVRTGIDVLEIQNFAPLREEGKTRRIGLVTNQTGVDSCGHRTIDLLARTPGIELAAIFSPEHGVEGKLETTEISETRDVASGVPVYSTYGLTDAARRPPMDIVRRLDVVVFDLQGAGARFYTYETTLGYFLEAAAAAGIEMIVLDRPNPVTGVLVQGPMPERESFVAYHRLPVRHGMTMGELARLFNQERGINARLTVVRMQGWARGAWFDSTGLRWINPSPNLRSLRAATLYLGVALIEGANVSVGRGTDEPFEVVGAPWIKPRELTAFLNARQIDGVRFTPVTFKPRGSKYAREKCGGVRLIVKDRDSLDAPRLGIELASALWKLYPGQLEIGKMAEIMADDTLLERIKAGEDPLRIAEDWRKELQEFEAVRQKYLLY